MARLTTTFLFCGLVFSLLSCSENKTDLELSVESKNNRIGRLIDRIHESSGIDSLGGNFNFVRPDSFHIDSNYVEIRRIFNKSILSEIIIEVFPKNAQELIDIKYPLLETFVGVQNTSCQGNFCSWYLKSKEELDVEVLFFEESEIRGFPYIAIRILEKDGIAG